ncbi:MAG: right-handed parallel beta-helix repeat-containing protein, partial [Rubrobacter sp.]
MIYYAGTLVQVSGSTFSNNTGNTGGAIAESGRISNSTFSGNAARQGGGAIAGGVTVLNSTFFGNSTRNQGGAIYLRGECEGSGIAELTVRNSTISNNSAAGKGGGIAAVACNPAFTIEKSIVAANTA